MLKTTFKSGWGRVAMAVAGSLIYALGVNLFIVPLGLFTGGLMGFCQFIRSLLLMAIGQESLPIDLAGVFFYAINVPLFVVGYKYMGKLFFRNTVIVSTTYSLFASFVPVPAAPIIPDVLTGCLIGGVISGIGTGLALTCGCSGGGLDLIGLCMAKKGAKVTVGQVNLVFNVTLFAMCAIIFDVPTMIYSVISTLFQAMAIDRAHKQSINVQVLIFTKVDSPELNKFIMETLHRGVTRWEGQGAYTGVNTHILCVCINKYEVDDLRQVLYKADPEAFFIIQEGVHISNNFERRLT